jgi:glycogen synthase
MKKMAKSQNTLSSSNIVDTAPTETFTKKGKEGISVQVDKMLVYLYMEYFGSRDDQVLQAIRHLVNKIESEIVSKQSNSKQSTKQQQGIGIFEELGGWKSIILKCHQMIARNHTAYISLEWEAVSLAKQISEIHTNLKQVEIFLANIELPENICDLKEILLVSGTKSGTTTEEGLPLAIRVVDFNLVWFSIQSRGRFDSYLRQVIHVDDSGRHTAAVKLYEEIQVKEKTFEEKFNWYVLILSQFMINGGECVSILQEIEGFVKMSNFNPMDVPSRRRIERLLIAMCGHEQTCFEADKLLSDFYAAWNIPDLEGKTALHMEIDQTVEIPCSGQTEFQLVGPVRGIEVSCNLSVSSGPLEMKIVEPGIYSFYNITGSKLTQVIARPHLSKIFKSLGIIPDHQIRSRLEDIREAHIGSGLMLDAVNKTCRGMVGDNLVDDSVFRDPNITCGMVIKVPLHVLYHRHHRKYRNLFVEGINTTASSVEDEEKNIGISKRDVLNYRMIETWDALIEDCVQWCKETRIQGILIDDTKIFNEPDKQELFMKDADGRQHYENLEILSGSIVKHENMEIYPISLIARLVKVLWKIRRVGLFVKCQNMERAKAIAESGGIPILGVNSLDVLKEAAAHSQSESFPLCIEIGKDLMAKENEETSVLFEIFLSAQPLVPVFSQYSPVVDKIRKLRTKFTAGSFTKLDDFVFVWKFGENSASLGFFCFNFGDQDKRISTSFKQFLSVSAMPSEFYVEFDPLEDPHAYVPWAAEDLLASDFEVNLNPMCCFCRIFKPSKVPDQSNRLLAESLRRGGTYFRSKLASALSGNDCSEIAKLWNSTRNLVQLSDWRVAVGENESTWNLCYAKLLKSATDHGDSALKANKVGTICFVTPELGKFSTSGGLGVMVDELSHTLANEYNQEILIISPYYERNRDGETGYLARDGIKHVFNMEISVGYGETVIIGVHEGVYQNRRLYFLHNSEVFPYIYPAFNPSMMTKLITIMGKAPLELLKKIGIQPSTIFTNDWSTGLLAGYAKLSPQPIKVFHIIHNLHATYEGRIYPHRNEDLASIHGLPTDFVVDPHWQSYCINPSRCALLCADQYGTVSNSYLQELLQQSPLAPILKRHPRPFAYPNGIPLEMRLGKLKDIGSHLEAKKEIIKKYFAISASDEELAAPLLGFVGRITQQKGVHMILEIAEQLIYRCNFKVFLMVAGKGTPGEPYSDYCCGRLWELRNKYPKNFWADPNLFFKDGPLLNKAADFALMPSMFEPGGIVQQEFFVAETPVIAFRTGGLKDTVREYYNGNKGNGFTFESYSSGDFAFAIDRALKIFSDEEEYQKLRENSRNSVVTCSMVAKAWLSAVFDLHGKTYYNEAAVNALMPQLTCESPVLAEEEIGVVGDSEQDEEEGGIERRTSFSIESSEEIRTNSPKSVSAGLARIFSTSSLSSVVSKRQVRVKYSLPFGDVKPHDVILVGSFDNWNNRIKMTFDPVGGFYFAELRIAPGQHMFKIISDGIWKTIVDYPLARDDSGNENNLLTVF